MNVEQEQEQREKGWRKLSTWLDPEALTALQELTVRWDTSGRNVVRRAIMLARELEKENT